MSKEHFCTERILPHKAHAPQRITRVNGRDRAVLFPTALWPTASSLRVRFLSGTSGQQAHAMKQALWWIQEAHANIKFEFTQNTNAEIRVAFDENDGAWSYIGTDALQIPKDQPTMNLGFLDGGTAAHEFGHALSLGHEHQNPEGGMQWNREAVIADLSGPPNNWSVEEIEQNVLDKYTVDHVRGTVFDPESIMLYSFPSSWTLNGLSTKANETLSTTDKAYISSSAAYPSAGLTVVSLSVVDTSGTQAGIGQPGEEDLFTFIVTIPGRHVIQTNGKTDVMMKLFGPDNPAILIAEDDDGGTGKNARIAANLSTGQYLIQVRHYNKTAGTGAYSILVSR